MTDLAFVFPGQGSQSVGMMSEWGAHQSLVNSVFDEASSALGYDLQEIIQSGPAETLNQTEITQPAMLASGVAAYRVWQSLDLASPTVVAGHSLGEYTALVCADSIRFGDAVKLVAERGEKVVLSLEGKRTVTRFADKETLLQNYKVEDWNHYRIVCKGQKITLSLNGVLMCEITDLSETGAANQGIIALQMHRGPPMKVQFKNITLKYLTPDTQKASSKP